MTTVIFLYIFFFCWVFSLVGFFEAMSVFFSLLHCTWYRWRYVSIMKS